MNEASEINSHERHRIIDYILPVAISTTISVFLYSGRNIIDCSLISVGIAVMSLAMLNICIACNMGALASSAAAMMLAFSPFTTELAILNPALPLISGAGIFGLSLWMRSLCFGHGRFNPSFLLIILPPLLWGVTFSLLANPDFMSKIDINTFFPMPVSEQPYPALAAVKASMYRDGLPVSVGYLMLILIVPGILKLNFNALLFAAVSILFTIPCFDKPLFDIPPGIWAVYSVAAISMLAANGIKNIADWIEGHFRIRPFWIIIIPVLEVLVIAYIMTY
ncbi:MAG: hypothetical protein ACIAQZ_08905 [Sedimentisphaeraceae bacterium JB056]